MNDAEKFQRFITRYPHAHLPCFRRPQLGRRAFFKLAGTTVTGSFMALAASCAQAGTVVKQTPVTTRNTAKQVIFLMLDGGPSQADTFDLKVIDGVTPNSLAPERINGVLWPTGLMPKLAQQLNDIAIIRSMRSWALVHEIGREWMQIGRNPNAREAGIAPHVGSVVALEKESERQAHQVFPGFIALNAETANGPGYLSGRYAPFKVSPTQAGLTNVTHADGETRFNERFSQLQLMDQEVRGAATAASPLGRAPGDLRELYETAKLLVHNDAVNRAFRVNAADHERYGNTSFGDACLVAKQILAARQGTRFIQINFGTWDHHRNLYASLGTMAKQFDDALAALLNDLRAAGMLEETLIVGGGEFGRTPGALNSQAGRDHFLQQSFLLMGAGVLGRTIGATNATAAFITEYGWSRNRDIRIEDIEATIYSAMGVNWTTIRRDDPLGIGFPYVPHAQDDVYGPVNELWNRTLSPRAPGKGRPVGDRGVA